MADFPIVGIGSSAGGLDALQKLFGAMPPESGFAFVVVAHLDPTHESQLAALIARCTPIPVNEVEEPVTVEPDHVYVIAPNQHLTFEGDVLRPSRPSEVRGERYPLDVFFRSLAEHQGNCAIGIVLSGTGTSGAQGLRAIKAEGGIAVAQDPGTAGFSDMPRHAIATGMVDLVLPPDQMPQALLRLVHHPYMQQQAGLEQLPQVDGQLDTLLSLLRAEAKQDFRCYKRRTLLRRTHRRMSLRQIEDMAVYIERLRNEPDELAALAKDLTINVSGFFRDPDAWETLNKKVIAQLVADRPDGASIRIWVPGCSTGEEAYSIAMLIAEGAAAVQKTFDLKIFASDVSEHLLPVARAGLYPASIAEDVRPARLERFFEREEDSYRVRRELREMITFAPQNLLQDPPFSRLDLITCRNLLIYLEPEFQKKVVALFHFALREGGHLFLGPAETISGHDDLFHPISKRWRIYTRVGQTRHDIVDFPLIGPGQVSSELPRTPGLLAEPRLRAREHFQRDLLERYAPASVLIDGDFTVHAFQGPTGEFLQHPSGDPTTNLLALAREGLEAPLRAAVRRALGEKQEVVADARVRRGGALQPIRIAVRPLRPARADQDMLTVSFFEREPVSEARPLGPVEARRPERELEAELNATREELRFTLEQMETSNAELHASNEEIRSINEEFQASNEELETSKEEQQSLNEELRTVNNQLQIKVQELERRTSDLNNLLNSTEIATLFLDREFGIRWFTPAMQGLLDLRASDVGRPVSHFAQRFTGADFVEEVREVLQRLVPRTGEVVGDDDRTYIRRILPYRTSDDRIDGVVVTFTDITERKLREQEIQRAREFAESIVETVREPLLVLTADLKVRSANRSFYRTFDVTREETEGRMIYDLGNRQWDIPKLRELLDEILPAEKQLTDFEVEREFEQIGRRTMLLNARQIDSVQLILLAIEDITGRRHAEAELETAHQHTSAILESITDAFYVVDREWRLTFVNRRAEELWNRRRDDLLGVRLWDLLQSEDIEANTGYQLLTRAAREQQPARAEFQSSMFGVWVSMSVFPHPEGLSVHVRDISVRKRAEQERELLARELSHRIKNTLAVVQALAMQTDGRIGSVEAFREAFVGRLQAMARSHSLLLDAHWRSADLKSLVEQTVAAYQVDHPEVVEVEGDPVVITPRQGLGLSLVLHELSTNAAKYGALSCPEGRLRVSWQIEQESGRRVRLRWQERHGPKVEPPTEKGFGLQMIERACTYELDGEVELDYALEGLTCVVVFPLG
jgi:two-component system CheB/CheR fusion protein